MTLENLVRIKQLNNEPPDKNEFEGLLASASDRLNDVINGNLLIPIILTFMKTK